MWLGGSRVQLGQQNFFITPFFFLFFGTTFVIFSPTKNFLRMIFIPGPNINTAAGDCFSQLGQRCSWQSSGNSHLPWNSEFFVPHSTQGFGFLVIPFHGSHGNSRAQFLSLPNLRSKGAQRGWHHQLKGISTTRSCQHLMGKTIWAQISFLVTKRNFSHKILRLFFFFFLL